MIIFFIGINKILGIIISAIVLFFYNEYIIDTYSYTNNTMTLESFSNYDKPVSGSGSESGSDTKSIYNNININDNKILLEHNLRPKRSNQQIIHKTNIKKSNEPRAFEKIMSLFPYF
jgi:hypothetical protein